MHVDDGDNTEVIEKLHNNVFFITLEILKIYTEWALMFTCYHTTKHYLELTSRNIFE